MGTLIAWFERGARSVWQTLERFVRLIANIVYAMLADRVGPQVAAVLTMLVIGVMVAGLVAGGVAATALIRDLMGDGESAQVVATAPTVVAPTAAGTPTAGPSPTASAPTLPDTITVRGTLDESVYADAALGEVVENSIVLQLPRDGGPVTGSAVVGIDNFPLGAILAGIREGMGGSLEDYPDLKSCLTLVRLKADIEGSYSRQDSSITGSAVFVAEVEDRPCLRLPPNMTRDQAMTPSTLTLNASFDGREVLGAFTNESGEEMKFQATAE